MGVLAKIGAALRAGDEVAALRAEVAELKAAKHVHYHVPPGHELWAEGEVVMIRPATAATATAPDDDRVQAPYRTIQPGWKP